MYDFDTEMNREKKIKIISKFNFQKNYVFHV